MFKIDDKRLREIEQKAIMLLSEKCKIHPDRVIDRTIKEYDLTTRDIGDFSDFEKDVIQQRLGIGYMRSEGEYHKFREKVCEIFEIDDERLHQIEERTIRLLDR